MSVQQASTEVDMLRELAEFPLVEACSGAARGASRRAARSRMARWLTGPGTSRFRSASLSG